MSDQTENPAPSSSTPAWVTPVAVLICATLGVAAIGQYALETHRRIGVISMRHLALGGVVILCLQAAVICLRARSPGGRLRRWMRWLVAAATVGLLPMLVCHIHGAYWAAVSGPRPLSALYRLPLICGLLMAAVLALAVASRWVLRERRARALTLAAAALALTVFCAEAVWSSFSPPYPGPLKWAKNGGFISSKIDEDVYQYPYIYRPEAGYREEWGSNPRGTFDEGNGLDYHINPLGLRGPLVPLARTADTIRIAFLGDSFTFSEGVRHEHSLPEQVARSLRRDCPGEAVEVINGGVGGFDTRQEVALYRHLLMPYRPDVVVVVMGLNDRSPSSVNQTRVWRRSKLERLSVILAHCRSLAQRVAVPDVPTTIDSYEPCFRALAELRRTLRPSQRLLVALYPSVGQLPDYPHECLHAEICDRLRAEAIDVIDLLPVLRAFAAIDLTVHPQQDAHPNEIAHANAAEAIAAWVRNDAAARLPVASADSPSEP